MAENENLMKTMNYRKGQAIRMHKAQEAMCHQLQLPLETTVYHIHAGNQYQPS